MDFPRIPESRRVAMLEPPAGTLRMVLDTDTYNEIDDQFALVHAALSPERLDLEAVYAAPFHNERSSGPSDGMERSYEEIRQVLGRLDIKADGLAFRGSPTYLPGPSTPVESDAAADLVRRARTASSDKPLYVAAIAAITNVASAILIDPSIIERIVVVWLGGNALHWASAREFNLSQDLHASRLIFDCGVPLVHVPCMGVTTHLSTTLAELERYAEGKGAIGDYLTAIMRECFSDHQGSSRVIWDIATTAHLVNHDWTPSALVHSPLLNDQHTYSHDSSRHLIRSVYYVSRDAIFRDLFTKLGRRAGKA